MQREIGTAVAAEMQVQHEALPGGHSRGEI